MHGPMDTKNIIPTVDDWLKVFMPSISGERYSCNCHSIHCSHDGEYIPFEYNFRTKTNQYEIKVTQDYMGGTWHEIIRYAPSDELDEDGDILWKAVNNPPTYDLPSGDYCREVMKEIKAYILENELGTIEKAV